METRFPVVKESIEVENRKLVVPEGYYVTDIINGIPIFKKDIVRECASCDKKCKQSTMTYVMGNGYICDDDYELLKHTLCC